VLSLANPTKGLATTAAATPCGSASARPAGSALVVIEVQCGDYLGEDDIERFDDRYGR